VCGVSIEWEDSETVVFKEKFFGKQKGILPIRYKPLEEKKIGQRMQFALEGNTDSLSFYQCAGQKKW
jgi:hypothetical protein